LLGGRKRMSRKVSGCDKYHRKVAYIEGLIREKRKGVNERSRETPQSNY